MLPRSGETDLAQLTAALRTAPRALGIPDLAEIRTVRIVGEDSHYNWGTILVAGGDPDPDAPDQISLADGSLQLLRRVIRLSELRSPKKLITLLSDWPSLPSQKGAVWQDTTYVNRFAGDLEAKHLPFWTLDISRQDTSSQNPPRTPPEPYFSPEANFFADQIAVAAAKWLRDPNGGLRWEIKGTTRVILFDPRAYFTRVESDTHQVRAFAHSSGPAPLVCWAQVDDFSGHRTDYRIDVVDGSATLELPEAIQGFELYLFDNTGQHFDRYSSRTQYFVPNNKPRRKARRFNASQEALLRDASSGETLQVELKEWIPPTADDSKYKEFLKSVCAFANAGGGRLYIGVRDDGGISGVDQPLKRAYEKDGRGDPALAREMYARKLRQNVREGIDPAFEATFTWIEHAGRSVLCVEVPAGADRPYQVIDGRQYFIRKNGRSSLALPHEVREMYTGQRDARPRF